MTDIKERLREHARLWRDAIDSMMRQHSYYIDEAADEIGRLEKELDAALEARARDEYLCTNITLKAEIERLRAALERFVRALDRGRAPALEDYDAARMALGESGRTDD